MTLTLPWLMLLLGDFESKVFVFSSIWSNVLFSNFVFMIKLNLGNSKVSLISAPSGFLSLLFLNLAF